MGDSQSGESPLKFGAWIASVGGGFVTEKGQPVGVQGEWATVAEEGAPKVLEMMPGGVGGNEGGGEVFAGVVIDREQEGLLGVGRPPRMNRRVMLPEFTDEGAFPAPPGFGQGSQGLDELGEVGAGESGDGFTVSVEGEAGAQFVGDQLVVGRPLKGQKGL